MKPARKAIKYQVALPPAAGGLRFEPWEQACLEEPGGLEVDVIYTTDAGTEGALRKARALAQNLDAHVRLVFICSVTYQLPLTAPAVSLPFLRGKLLNLASSFSGETSVHIFLCREPLQTLEELLPQSRLIVLGGRKRWWPTRERRLERRLKEMGHEVIFVDSN